MGILPNRRFETESSFGMVSNVVRNEEEQMDFFHVVDEPAETTVFFFSWCDNQRGFVRG